MQEIFNYFKFLYIDDTGLISEYMQDFIYTSEELRYEIPFSYSLPCNHLIITDFIFFSNDMERQSPYPLNRKLPLETLAYVSISNLRGFKIDPILYRKKNQQFDFYYNTNGTIYPVY